MTQHSAGFLDTVEGEITFFRSLMRSRPVGLHRHFHALSMRTAIHQDTGRYVTMDEIWEKLRSLYNLKALEELDAEGYDPPTPHVNVPSPEPSQKLSNHPFFHKEYELPVDATVEAELARRRVRDTPSPLSSPAPTPSASAAPRGKNRPRASKGKNKGKAAEDESDASELTQVTQDDDDLSAAEVLTERGTADGTEDDDTPGPTSKKRGGPKRRGAGGRGRGGRGGTTKKAKKK